MILEIVAIVGAVGTLVAAIPPALAEIRERRQLQIDDLKNYLYTLAECLDEMVQELDNDRVPTNAGNRIETAFRDFDKKLDDLKLEDAKKTELSAANIILSQSLTDGQFLDDVIRGHISLQSPDNKVQMLASMARTSGYLKGVADTLK